jgi:hypothetical protein
VLWVTAAAIIMLVLGIIMRSVMAVVMRKRCHCVVQVRLRRQMNGNVANVEYEDGADSQAAPPARWVQWAS